ncbi:MAG TPA: heme biosynthesis protein HemY [Burkholderiales bacterium]
MRALIWVVGLAAVAVALVLAARYNHGYVLVVLPPWRMELSFNFAVLLAAAAFIGLYVAVRAVMIAITMPVRVREFQKRRAAARARQSFNDALVNFFEGRFGRAEKAAAAALKADESRVLSAVLAARAAHGMRAFSARDSYLAKAASADPDENSMRLIAQVEMLLDERRYHDALDVLRQLPEKHTAALRLELRAQQMAKNWDRVLALIPQLEKRKVFERPVVAQLRRQAIIESLKHKALDTKSLREYWDRLPDEDKTESRIAAAAAAGFVELGACDDARRIIEQSVERLWDQGLIALYSECLGTDVTVRLERSEKWLESHPKDAVLLLTLGRLCAHQGLWGKARSYLDASLSIESTHSAHLELARLLEREGKVEQATAHYQKALDVTLGQLRQHAGGRRRSVL